MYELLAAGMKPPHLKAIFPQCYSFDYYFGKSQGGIPAYQWASWNDLLTKVMRDAFIYRANVKSVLKTSVGPLGHCGFGSFNILAEERRWFDYWLKNINNGILDEPSIYFNTINAKAGREWRYSWKWPLPNEKRMIYYLEQGPSGSLYYQINSNS